MSFAEITAISLVIIYFLSGIASIVIMIKWLGVPNKGKRKYFFLCVITAILFGPMFFSVVLYVLHNEKAMLKNCDIK
jgi:hypothetical protein